MRRLVVCADGTWNSEDGGGDPSRVTNVVRIRDGIQAQAPDGVAQVVYYHPGVGVNGRFDRWTGGAFGTGISRNIKACYDFLVREYEPGDQLFFFGFSRGAYTVRSLAGLVRNCGILRREHRDRVDEAYDLYRSRRPDDHPNADNAKEFRGRYSHESRVRCLGVWDTVGALGVPTRGPVGWLSRRRHGFHDVTLSSRVENAFHALAIDERRGPFAPTLWEVRDGDPARGTPDWRVEQRWFAGVHSNVGGGYPNSGLSSLALRWMVDRAASCGLAFAPEWVSALDPACDCGAELYDSMSRMYRMFPAHERALDAERKDARTGERLHTHEDVDSSVPERHEMAHLDPRYGPANLLDYWRRRPRTVGASVPPLPRPDGARRSVPPGGPVG
jgi:uncharacterized protein (DUF2235 family)